ncbi:YebC-like protein [Lepidopterella palustris CBS 459.81]|uniref:YebC-like protein n=1 Tax=Lepidopterella palustris CBS 459.81 TaxID=1314670 RepID=A0A8E2E964_9PEZI|nr:YebC-like protein [Lepidopterella palustris CBS 459.81]
MQPMSTVPRRLLTKFWFSDSYTCSACRSSRFLSTSTPLRSGHSKWATIKHDKAKNDASKNKQRADFSHEISTACKMFGPDPNTNPRLALAISTAKKAGVPKTIIENALARGQGVSASGAALESVVVEAIMPPSVATVIDCQTDNKLRTLADIRLIIKEHDGTVTPTDYLFGKKGRITFLEKEGVGVDEVLEQALDAGALDVVEGEDGKVVVFTETNETKSTAQALSSSLGLEIKETEIIWDPNEETKVGIEDEEAAKRLSKFLDKIRDISGVQGVYMNFAQGSIDDGLWSDLRRRVAA